MTKIEESQKRIEAVLFASGEPIERKKISAALAIDEETVHKLVLRLRDEYTDRNSPIQILVLDESYQMATCHDYAIDIRTTLEAGKISGLSPAALEVLAIIAYNQPVTKAFVEEIRGVDCSYIMRALIEKGLLQEAGRMNIPGKPIIYQTTPIFLRSFMLESLDDLPALPAPVDEGELEGQIDLFG